jgi:flagellar hook assembly protein FlgD
LQNLTNGFHKISLKAWDFYNNSSETEISFFVLDQPVLSMQQVFNFPNPVRDQTTFQFNPMQNAGRLDIQIQVSSITGTIVKTIESKVSEYGTGPVFIHWDGRNDNGSKLNNGLYLYRLLIKGENGTSTQATQKLVIMN